MHMKYIRQVKKDKGVSPDQGFTLLEVLAALLISGILLSIATKMMFMHWRQANELNDLLDLNYALCSAEKVIEDAIRTARSVQWEGSRLQVISWDKPADPADSYYVADLDANGVPDLYYKIRSANPPLPLISYISEFSCAETEPGLWRIVLSAQKGRQNLRWVIWTRQRISGRVEGG